MERLACYRGEFFKGENMVKLKTFFWCYLLSMLVFGASALELQTLNQQFKIGVKGNGSFWFGQVNRGTGIQNNGTVKNVWTQNAYTSLLLDVLYKGKLQLVAGIEAETKFSWPIESQFSESKIARPEVYILESYGKYLLRGNINVLDFTAGVFKFKYNPDVRNLGEFLFRSATYPTYVRTDFDDISAKLLGFKVSHNLSDCFTQHLLFTTETVFYPAMDWSLAYLVNYDFFKKNFINLGAGISLAHLISVYDRGMITTPRTEENRYIKDGDTSYYSFKGNKAMLKFSVDPLAFVRPSPLFGKNDLKIYAEALLVGWKSYPDTTAKKFYTPSYSDWKEKTIITFGFNLPTFTILDVLSLEFEYWGSEYYNDYRQIYVQDGRPLAPGFNENVKESKWKWSLYMKKTFFNEHMAVTAQCARDHMRLFSALYDRANHREMLVQAGDWWWVTKISFNF
jgi:hypothetical protein